MGFNEFLSSIFGNKSTRDMKEIKPWVEKIKAAYPEIESTGQRRPPCQNGRTQKIHPRIGY